MIGIYGMKFQTLYSDLFCLLLLMVNLLNNRKYNHYFIVIKMKIE